MSDTKSTWRTRIANWRASGKTAKEFSKDQGFEPSTLRWWSSRLGDEITLSAMASPPPAPMVRLARVLRARPADGPPPVISTGRGAIIVEMLDARARIVIENGAERDTLAMVLDLVEARGWR